MEEVKLLDAVALLQDIPERGLKRGEVGTVVEVFEAKPLRPKAYLIEFCDRNGITYSMTTLRVEQIIQLYYREAA
jgi:hypothetical protein